MIGNLLKFQEEETNIKRTRQERDVIIKGKRNIQFDESAQFVETCCKKVCTVGEINKG